MKYLWVLVCVLVLSPLTLSADEFSTYYFQASLSPSAETPEPITDTLASGNSLVRIHVRKSDEGEFIQAAVDFDTTLSVVPEQSLTNMHIHKAALGSSGGVVIDSHFNGPIPVEANGTARIIRQFIVEADNTNGITTIEEIIENPEGFYVNVHSSAHPAGVARGQLHPIDLSATLAVGGKVDETQASLDALQTQVAAMQTLLTRIAMRFSINP